MSANPKKQDRRQGRKMSSQTLVSVRNLSVDFRSGEQSMRAVDGVSFNIGTGETVAIVGQTGSGKSSLVSLIARFYEVNSGGVFVDGYDVRSVTLHSLRKQIGIVPQDPILFTGTIEENIRFGNPDVSREGVVEVARAVGAHPFG